MPSRGGALTYSYFRGFLAPQDARNADQYVVVGTPTGADGAPPRFFMAAKASVKPTRITRTIFARHPRFALDLCCDRDSQICPKGAVCSGVHLKEPPVEIAVTSNDTMLACLKNGSNTHLTPSELQPTAGLMFYSTLKDMGLIKDAYPWVCNRFLRGTCPSGDRCLFLHVPSDLVRNIQRPPVEASTTIYTSMQQSIPSTPGLRPFIDTTLNKMGIRTIGDLAMMSNAAFDAIMEQNIRMSEVKGNDSSHRPFWLLLLQQRSLTRSTPLRHALMQFPNIDVNSIETVTSHPWLQTVGDLCTLRPKVLYVLSMRAQLLDACERIRARFDDDREPYNTVSLVDLPESAFFKRMANLVCGFRETHAHKSWRKQDATRPIVTSLITYVNPDTCTCQYDPAAVELAGARSPSVGPRDVNGCVHSLHPAHIPSYDHWCHCPREHTLAVNYELSTPSGSRCSEQNALGALASMGLPTTCVREVFVHGGKHNGEEQNPLFPCGVCENMFRRVSKDVQKAHGGDVNLYMFDQESNPRKLTALPVAEISHRGSTTFRKWVNEELRDGADGMMGFFGTPNATLYMDETPCNERPIRQDEGIPAAPVSGGNSPCRN
jgi:hypothetical protein